MIRVMHVISDKGIGGAGRWLMNLAGSYDSIRFELEAAVPEGSLLKELLEKAGVKVIIIPEGKEESLDYKTISFLYHTFKRRKIDIVHTHASLSARIAAKLARVKGIVHTKHCIDELNSSSFKRHLAGKINNYLSDRVTAVSAAVRDNLLESGVSPGKIKVIYNGIEELQKLSESKKSELRQGLSIEDDDVVVGMFARLEAVKGHEAFIRAAKLVNASHGKVRFLIAGTGSQEEKLKELAAAEGLKDKMIFTGHLEDITEMLNITDINVITSISEALCLALIEGFSLSKPAVATRVGGIPEVVEDGANGFLVPVNDEVELSEAIIKLCKDTELRQEMGIAGRRTMENRFSICEMINEIQTVYEELGRNKT